MRTRRRNKMAPFVAIEKAMLRSEAWEKIGNASRVAFLHIKAEMVSANTNHLELSYRQMEGIMAHHTFSCALRELEDAGFIEREQRGGLFRRKNIFRIIDGWRDSSSISAPKQVQFLPLSHSKKEAN
jgi:hypothetical protein